MPRPLRPIFLFAIFLLPSLFSTCSDKGNDSNDPGANFGEMAADLEAAEAYGLRSNEDLFASAEAMMPAISAILRPNSAAKASSVAAGPCLPDGVGERIYTFDGVSYSGAVNAAIAQSTARFVLYQLFGTGQPDPARPMGHIDFTCFDIVLPVTEVQMAIGTTVVVSTNLSQSTGRATGTFRDTSASHPVPFEGYLGEGQRLSVTFDISDRFKASYESALPGGSSGPVMMTVTDPEENAVGSFTVEFEVDNAGNVTVGSASFQAGSGTFAAACINAGTLDAPTFTAADTDCANGQPMSVTPEQLQAMSASYRSLRRLWLAAADLVEICRSLVPADTQ